jgi:hypothetical protein
VSTMPCDCGHPRKPDHYQNGGIIRCHCGCEYGHGAQDTIGWWLFGYWHPRHVFPEVTV